MNIFPKEFLFKRQVMLLIQQSRKEFYLFMLLMVIFIPSRISADEKNINKLLNNQAVVSRQIMCILEKSPCDQLGRQIKAALPEVITRKCRNCSPQQAQSAQKLTSFLQARYPDVWAMLIRKYQNVQNN